MRRLALAAGFAALLVPATPASGATRLAEPAGTTSGDCLTVACRLDRALVTAQPGDHVVLADGTYTVSYPAEATRQITIRPAVHGTRPRLVGAGLSTPTLRVGAAARVNDLQIETSASAQPALELGAGAHGYGLDVRATTVGGTAPAVRLLSAPNPTALVSSVAWSRGSFTAIDAIDGPSPGGVSMVHVTAVSSEGNSWGVTTDLSSVRPVLKSSIVLAPGKALHGRSGTQAIATSSTAFTSSGSANWLDGGGNQTTGTVSFVDAATGDFRTTAASPTVNAGAADALSADWPDAAGGVRFAESAPDMGAYELNAAPAADPWAAPTEPPLPPAAPAPTPLEPVVLAPTPGETPAAQDGPAPSSPPAPADPIAADPLPTRGLLDPLAPPIVAERVAVEPAGGTTLVRLPGAPRFVPLTAGASVPVGATVDATAGHVKLTSVRDRTGRAQTGEFWGGVFQVRQKRARDPQTELVLTGASFAGCPSARRAGRAGRKIATASAKRRSRGRSRRSVVRRLWGRDKKGRFTTRGRHSAATVRGTVWLVEDRCDGTLTRVREGAVEVREHRTGRRKLVRAGASHLTRARAR